MTRQTGKFSPYMLMLKAKIRHVRLAAGYSMNKGAEVLGVSRKKLEDIETIRDYGCHIDVEVLGRASQVYGERFDTWGPCHMSNKGGYFERPRLQGGARNR